MLSGLKTLNDLDNSLNLARRDMVRIDRELDQLTKHLSNNQRQQATILRQIAASRLDAIAGDALQQKLNQADEQALAILQNRQHSLTQLQDDIEALNEQLHQLESQRQSLHDTSSAIASQLADTEASTQAMLKNDADYQTLFEHARQADSIADEAEIKAQQAKENMTEKGQPYREDERFIYLWERKFGTTEYQGGLLTRLLDKWVANLIGYEPARQNYWNIQEIPKRLEQHATRVRKKAQDVIQQLQDYEKKQMEAAGVLQLQIDYEQSRVDIDAHDQKIDHLEASLNEQLQNRAQFSSAQDPDMLQALQTLHDAMQHQSLQQLQQSVFATPSLRDDSLVNELYQYQLSLKDTEANLHDLRQTHGAKLTQLQELEMVRRKFKLNRFDDMRSGFSNQALIASALTQFMQGMMNGNELWKIIQRNQQHRDVGAWPDFGSGGLGQGSVWGDILTSTHRHRPKQRDNTWHWPNAGNGGFRLPSGRPSSGGFKTGGGF